MIEQDVSARVDPGLIELQRDVLRMGHPLRVKLHGMSMFPIIRPGDVVAVRAVEWTALRRGDIIYYERESRLVAHRTLVPPSDADSPLIAKGDTLPNCDPPVRPDQLVGRVEAVERNGHARSLTRGWGRAVQILAAEGSGPYAALFWKGAALRRRVLKRALDSAGFRARRRQAHAGIGKARPYADDDLDALANALWDLQRHLNFARMREWTGERVRDMREGGAAIYVYDDGRRVVGLAALSPADESGTARLLDLYVHPLARGCGWGDALLMAMERETGERGARALRAEVTETATKAASRLLKKRGWQPLGSGEGKRRSCSWIRQMEKSS